MRKNAEPSGRLRISWGSSEQQALIQGFHPHRAEIAPLRAVFAPFPAHVGGLPRHAGVTIRPLASIAGRIVVSLGIPSLPPSPANRRSVGRQTWYLTPAEIQRDRDVFLDYYNHRRSHQGYRLKVRTPAMALQQALQIDALPPMIPEPEETEETTPDTLAA